MIVASCPLRISLVGGSTDHPEFLKRYEQGSVISFPSTLRTYVTLHQDQFGINSVHHKYNINYSQRETVEHVQDIKNQLVRLCFERFQIDRVNCTLVSDIYSTGSGLASSSAYLMSLIKACGILRESRTTDADICKLALSIEREFNPLVGQQDFYGSLGGFKRLNFYQDSDPEIRYLSSHIFDHLDIHLLYTGVLRNSTEILETLDLEKSRPLLHDVEDLEQAIMACDLEAFSDVMKRSWQQKKRTSALICDNTVLKKLDEKLSRDNRVLAHKLCGAGAGGCFLIFSLKYSDLEDDYDMIKRISISESGILGANLQHESVRI